MVRFEDENGLVNAIKNVRNDTTEDDWVLAGHVESNPEVVTLVGTGTGGAEAMLAHFQDNSVLYGLIRVVEKIDLSQTIKFVYVYYIGDNVPAMQRGKIGTAHGQVKTYFSPYHIDFEITNPNEISTEIITNKIAVASGKASKVREVSYDNKQTKGPTKSNFGFQGTSAETRAGTGHPIHSDVLNAIAELRDNKNNVNWVAATYEDNDVKKQLVLLKSGSGGSDELLSNLTPDIIAYAIIRVVDVIEGIKTTKYAFISYIGQDVGFMKKAKIATHTGSVKAGFGAHHVTLDVERVTDLSDEILLLKVQETSGSKSKVK